MKNNRFFRITFFTFLIAVVLLTIAVFNGITWVKLSNETAKIIAATIVGATGSIIGFLVIYLSISFETIRRNYGKHALQIFRKDIRIWSLGYLFAFIIIVGIFSLVFTDQNGKFWIWLFNMTCLCFIAGVGLIFPFGNAILNKSSTGILIEQMIKNIKESDFKDPPPRHAFPASIYWVVSESNDNNVDIISNILYHNINEGNTKIATQILLEFFARITIISKGKTEYDLEKVIYRYLDILQTSFDYSNSKKDNISIKIILAALNSCSQLIGERHWGKGFIEKEFEVVINVTKSLIESENEQLITESLWTYYHMCKTQISQNLPVESETWEKDEEGFRTIDSDQGWANDSKFEAINKPMTYDLSGLVARTFLCENYYIIEGSVGMMSSFVEMIIFDNRMGPLQKDQIGSMLSYECSECINRFIGNRSQKQRGYLDLYVGQSNIVRALEEDSRFSKSVFDGLISIVNNLLELDLITKFDLERIGGLCRMIIGNTSKIPNTIEYVKTILEMQKKIEEYFSGELKQTFLKEGETTLLKEMISLIQKDLKSYKWIYTERRLDDVSLIELIDSYQI